MDVEQTEIPDPIIRQTFKVGAGDVAKMRRQLEEMGGNDPTLRFSLDPDGAGSLMGMGHGHLEIYLENIRENIGIEIQTGEYEIIYVHRSTETWHVKQQPIMLVQFTIPAEKKEVAIQFVAYKRGEIVSTKILDDDLPAQASIEATVPLAELEDFYDEVKRIANGFCTCGMSFHEYRDIPEE